MTRRCATALQNPYREAAGPPEPGRTARAVTVGAFAIGAALAGGILTAQAAQAEESDGGTTCETGRYGQTGNSADSTPCATGSNAESSEPTGEEPTGEEPTGETAQVVATRDSGVTTTPDSTTAPDSTTTPDATTPDATVTSLDPAATQASGGTLDSSAMETASTTSADDTTVAAAATPESAQAGTSVEPDAATTGTSIPSTLDTEATTSVVTTATATDDATGRSPQASTSTDAGAATTTTPDGQGTLYADATTGAVYTPYGALVPGLAYDPTTGSITDGTRTGTASPALLTAADTGNGAATTSPSDEAAVRQALATLTPEEQQQLAAARTLPTGQSSDPVPVTDAAPSGEGGAPEGSPAQPDQVAIKNLLTIAGAALNDADGEPGNVGDLLRKAGIGVALHHAGQELTGATGTETLARVATPALKALLTDATDGGGIDLAPIQEAAIRELVTEGIRQLAPEATGPLEDVAPAGGKLIAQLLSSDGLSDKELRDIGAELAGSTVQKLMTDAGLGQGALEGVPSAGADAVSQLFSPDGLTGEKLGDIGEELAVKTVGNVIKDAVPGVGGAAAAGAVGPILDTLFNPDRANPLNIFSAVANGIVPGAGLVLSPLTNWAAKEDQRKKLQKQMGKLNAEAANMGMTAVSQFRDPATMQPLTLTDRTTFEWSNGQPVLDPNTGQLRPYGTAFYQDGNTIQQMTDIGGAIPHAVRQVQEAEVAEIKANLAAGLNGDGTPRTPDQQRMADLVAKWTAQGRTDLLASYNNIQGGMYQAPDPSTIEVELGEASGWEAHKYAVAQNAEARALDPTHPATGLTTEETAVRADAATATEKLEKLLVQERWAMAGSRYSGGRAGRMIDPPPAPDRDEMARLRAEALSSTAALALGQSPLADGAKVSPWAVPECDPESWDEQKCGPYLSDNPRQFQTVDQTPEVKPIDAIAIEKEIAAPSAQTQQLAAEIAAARTQPDPAGATADYKRVVEGPCGEDGHAGQVNCFGAWNELLHPYGGEIPYSMEIAEKMAQAHAIYAARKELLGHDVARDQRTYIMGAPLQPQVPEFQATT